MKKLLTLILILFAAPCFGESYVDGSKSFLEIKDVHREADAWAMCAATYDAMAELVFKDKPARYQQISELVNGAEAAVAMSIVTDGLLDTDITPERFSALWNMAKFQMDERPKTRRTFLLAEMESIENEEQYNVFLSNLSATFEVCLENLEGQRMYVDSWRELDKSGLLKHPNE